MLFIDREISSFTKLNRLKIGGKARNGIKTLFKDSIHTKILIKHKEKNSKNLLLD